MTESSNDELQVDNTANELIHQQAFGDVFRTARESAGYTITEVSDSLKLAEEIIKALENSQVDLLPAATFTQGYIRNYARFLKLPADDIIKAYNKIVPSEEPALIPTTGAPVQKTSHDTLVKLTSYGLFFIVIMSLLLWWLQSDVTFSTDDSETVNEKLVPEVIAPSIEEIDIEEQVQEERFSEKIIETPNEKDEIKTIEKNTSTIKEAPVDQKPVEKKVTVTGEGEDLLELSTDSESWTEVQDANGNRLFFELMKKGDIHQLKGTAPFRVFLGNAPTVKVNINNQDVDISNYIRQNKIAHISIQDNAVVQSTRRIKKPDTEPQQENSVTQQEPDESSREIMLDDSQ